MSHIFYRLLFAAILLLTMGFFTPHAPFITAAQAPWVAAPTNTGGNMIFTKGDQCSISISSQNTYNNGLLLQAKKQSWWTGKIQQQWIFGFFLYGDENNVEITQKWGENQEFDSGPNLFSRICIPYVHELPHKAQIILHKYGFGFEE